MSISIVHWRSLAPVFICTATASCIHRRRAVPTVPAIGANMLSFWRMQRRGTLSNALSIVEMNVHMDCEGCERRIRKAMSRLEGVSTVEIDMDTQKVTVTGYVDRRKVLRAARRTGRAAEFWPWPYDGEYYPFAIQYLEDDTYMPTHKYYLHGYNDPVIGYYPCHAFTHVLDDQALALFNEDNVHACTVM